MLCDQLIDSGDGVQQISVTGNPARAFQRDVIPGAHDHALIDCDGAMRGMGQDVAYVTEPQGVGDSHKIFTIGTQSV